MIVMICSLNNSKNMKTVLKRNPFFLACAGLRLNMMSSHRTNIRVRMYPAWSWIEAVFRLNVINSELRIDQAIRCGAPAQPKFPLNMKCFHSDLIICNLSPAWARKGRIVLNPFSLFYFSELNLSSFSFILIYVPLDV